MYTEPLEEHLVKFLYTVYNCSAILVKTGERLHTTRLVVDDSCILGYVIKYTHLNKLCHKRNLTSACSNFHTPKWQSSTINAQIFTYTQYYQ